MSEAVGLARGLPSTIREGEILGGKYRLEREIGRGSMGTVWSAVHLTLGQRVAIKLISAEHAQAPEARRRFSTEAKAAARLRSRYVVQVYDDGETVAGTPYIVLEYLDGETLEQRLDREHHLPLNDAVRVTRHVARALSRAHAQGIVHRDLKPANVFLTRSDDEDLGWVAKVLDFGIAKLEEHGVASLTKTGTLLGTPLFMSPEQVRGARSVDARADLYALGMVFYDMLTGGAAFNGDSFTDVLVAICTAPLPDLRVKLPWLPESLGVWFQRACARDLKQRFQSADEMVEALDQALGVTSVAPSRESLPEVRLDTLRGHAPPVTHSVPRAPVSDSHDLAHGVTQVMGMDPALLKSNPVDSAETAEIVELELAHPPSRRLLKGASAGLLFLLLLGGVVVALKRGSSVPPRAEIVGTPVATGHPVQRPSVAPAPLETAPPQTPIAVATSPGDGSAPPPGPVGERGPPQVAVRPVSASAAGKRPTSGQSNVSAGTSPSARNATTDIGF